MAGRQTASVIVASYDNADILALTLAALARQSAPAFEVIVADDGSRESYAPLLEAWAAHFPRGIQHVRHEDKGFRKTRILNRAIHVSRFERLIFIDMDCLPHRDFVRNHVAQLESGTVVTGRRVHIEKAALPSAEEILRSGLRLGFASLLRLWVKGKARRIEHGWVSPIAFEVWNSAILGSNFSIHKADLEAVNGFNEEYAEPGYGEDSDLELRLRLDGIRIKTMPNTVVQYHVHHPSRLSYNEANRALYERTRATRAVRAAKGLAEIQAGDFALARYGG